MKTRGVTLLETIIVLAIIAGMLALLFPAVQHARETAREASCRSNLRQISIAMRVYAQAANKLPDPALANKASGWVVTLLPFLDEGNIADRLGGNPSLVSLVKVPYAVHRPLVLTCPAGFEGDSNIPPIPVSHYSASLARLNDKGFLSWSIKDVMTDSRVTWLSSPEKTGSRAGDGPHAGGYLVATTDGSVHFISGR